MDVVTTFVTVSQASSPFLLVLALWGFLTGRVVPRWVYDAERQRADEWKAVAHRYQQVAERSLNVAEQQREAA